MTKLKTIKHTDNNRIAVPCFNTNYGILKCLRHNFLSCCSDENRRENCRTNPNSTTHCQAYDTTATAKVLLQFIPSVTLTPAYIPLWCYMTHKPCCVVINVLTSARNRAMCVKNDINQPATRPYPSSHLIAPFASNLCNAGLKQASKQGSGMAAGFRGCFAMNYHPFWEIYTIYVDG